MRRPCPGAGLPAVDVKRTSGGLIAVGRCPHCNRTVAPSAGYALTPRHNEHGRRR